jgi:hypothetical protein
VRRRRAANSSTSASPVVAVTSGVSVTGADAVRVEAVAATAAAAGSKSAEWHHPRAFCINTIVTRTASITITIATKRDHITTNATQRSYQITNTRRLDLPKLAKRQHRALVGVAHVGAMKHIEL